MTREFVQQLMGRPVVRDFLRFAVVGALATAVHYGLLIAMVELGGVGPVFATICGFLAVAMVSYILNRRYTFFNKPKFGKGFAKYLVVIMIGALINAGAVAAVVASGVHYMIGQVVATGIVLILNFCAARVFVFR